MQIRSIAIVAALSLPLAAYQCQTGAPTEAACLALRPISYSALDDTPQTVAEVREHNVRLLALCPGLAPPK